MVDMRKGIVLKSSDYLILPLYQADLSQIPSRRPCTQLPSLPRAPDGLH